MKKEEPRFATASELAVRLGPEEDMLMLLTAISDAGERHDPSTGAVTFLETDSGFQVLILSPDGCDHVCGLSFEP
jgi:hypothetical protein